MLCSLTSRSQTQAQKQTESSVDNQAGSSSGKIDTKAVRKVKRHLSESTESDEPTVTKRPRSRSTTQVGKLSQY